MTDPNAAEHQYVTGQMRSTFADLLAMFEEQSLKAASARDAELDIAYGPNERQRYDFFPAPRPSKVTLVYFHAGYWQSRDKQSFRFLAPSFNQAGLNVALVNYPLCPTVTVAALVDTVRASIPAIAASNPGGQMILAGHSAGGHLAVELAMMEWAKDVTIRSVVCLSGVFDLEPLVDTSLNRNLSLTPETARAASPVNRVIAGLVPAIFAVGRRETDAFVEQNDRMAKAWQAQGNRARTLIIDNADHFTILRTFADPGSDLFVLTIDGGVTSRNE